MAILQINVNHSGPAQDLALDMACKVDARLVIISEPYLIHGRMPSTTRWQRVYTTYSAILVEGEMKFTQMNVSSDCIVAIEVGGVLVIGVYLSPNSGPEDALTTLHNLLIPVRHMVVAGDFNCRHPDYMDWEMRRRDLLFQQHTGPWIANCEQ